MQDELDNMEDSEELFGEADSSGLFGEDDFEDEMDDDYEQNYNQSESKDKTHVSGPACARCVKISQDKTSSGSEAGEIFTVTPRGRSKSFFFCFF